MQNAPDPAPSRSTPAPWLVTIFTSMFMHGGFLHIVFNMLFLWIFGNNIEDAMGRGRFLLFYLLGGLAAVYAQSAARPGLDRADDRGQRRRRRGARRLPGAPTRARGSSP